MAIVVVRHGQTALNASQVLQPPDTPLDEMGMVQAERLARRSRELGLTRLVSSTLVRARMTAEPIAARTGLPLELEPMLQERNFGDHRGSPYAELPREVFERAYQPPNGEGWGPFEQRVAQAWKRVRTAANQTEGTLLVVTHGLVLAALATYHLTLAPRVRLPDRWANTSVTRCTKAEPHWTTLVNCTAHLVSS